MFQTYSYNNNVTQNFEESELISLQRRKYGQYLGQIQTQFPLWDCAEMIKQSWNWFLHFSQSDVLQHKYNVAATHMTLLAATVVLSGELKFKQEELQQILSFMKDQWNIKLSRMQKLLNHLRREIKPDWQGTAMQQPHTFKPKSLKSSPTSVQCYLEIFCKRLKIESFRATQIAAIRKQNHAHNQDNKWIAAYILLSRMTKTFGLPKKESVLCVSKLSGYQF